MGLDLSAIEPDPDKAGSVQFYEPFEVQPAGAKTGNIQSAQIQIMATVVINTITEDYDSNVDSSERAIVLQVTKKGLALPTIAAKIEIGDTGSGGLLSSVYAKGRTYVRVY